jgi:Lar family restriction alleviation protein
MCRERVTHLNTIELKPCPFCSNKDLEILDGELTGFAQWVNCSKENCNTAGPARLSEKEAIEAWNTRK